MKEINNNSIPIVIPAYEPNERLVELIKQMQSECGEQVILVDDGSGPQYRDIFDQAKKILGDRCVLITHETNK